MKRLATLGFLTCVLFLTGCGNVTGKWTLDCITPETEREHFDIKCLVLNADNTYRAMATEQCKPVEMCGKYCYDKDTKALTFTPEGGGPVRTYTAQVELNGKMKVCPADQATWTAYLKHCKCDSCACTCKCNKCEGKCGGKCGCKACKCGGKCDGKCTGKCDKSCKDKPCEKKPTECSPAEKKGECPMHKSEPVKVEPGTSKN